MERLNCHKRGINNQTNLTLFFLCIQIISCGGDLNGDQNNRQRTKDCYTLEAGTNGDKKWTYYNSFTEVLGGEDLGIKSIFMPKKGTYIFGDIKSQFLPVGSTKWQPGNKDADLEEN